MAASESTLAATVPPMPPVSAFSSAGEQLLEPLGHVRRESVGRDRDAGPDRLADREQVGLEPVRRVYPPGPAQSVCVSSMISSVPVSRVAARSCSWKPGSGRTMPMFVSAGSASTHATSP